MPCCSTIKKGQTTDPCNVDKSQKRDAERKKPDTNVLILCDSISMSSGKDEAKRRTAIASGRVHSMDIVGGDVLTAQLTTVWESSGSQRFTSIPHAKKMNVVAPLPPDGGSGCTNGGHMVSLGPQCGAG